MAERVVWCLDGPWAHQRVTVEDEPSFRFYDGDGREWVYLVSSVGAMPRVGDDGRSVLVASVAKMSESDQVRRLAACYVLNDPLSRARE